MTELKVGEKVRYKEDSVSIYEVVALYPESEEVSIFKVGGPKTWNTKYKYCRDWFYSITPLPLEDLV